MAKIYCPECLNDVDDQYVFCPHCGHPLASAVKEERFELDELDELNEESHWSFGNTLVVLLLMLLIFAIGAFLYFNALKWPYEDAMDYYAAEKQAYEEQVAEYKDIAAQIGATNAVLDAKIEALNDVLNSGDEPLDPATAKEAADSVIKAQEARIDTPVIEANEIPVPARDSILHAKDIRDTAKMIDQQRFTLYEKYRDLQMPDYASVIDNMDRKKAALEESIQQKKDSDNVSLTLKQTLEDYVNFMDEYITFMADYDRSNPEMIENANVLQTQYVTYLKVLKSINLDRLSEVDRRYYETVTTAVSERMAENNLQETAVTP